jgi:hypothetical protein
MILYATPSFFPAPCTVTEVRAGSATIAFEFGEEKDGHAIDWDSLPFVGGTVSTQPR